MNSLEIRRQLPAMVEVVQRDDPAYRAALRAIADPPQTLQVRGTLRDEDKTALAFVGARRASAYGVAVAEWLGRELARCGVTGTPPLLHHFPQRNFLISGLSLGVVVVEGRERSGVLGTADRALEQGREVLAVPGPIFTQTSALTHRLMPQGAKLVARVEDILEGLRLPKSPPPSAASAIAVEGTEATVYAQLTLDPQHIDTPAGRCGLPMAEVGRAVVGLELRV